MQTATVHALPSCNIERIIQLRQAAQQEGARYVPSKPNFAFATGHVDALPSQHSGRRFFVRDEDPIDPNDGGSAA